MSSGLLGEENDTTACNNCSRESCEPSINESQERFVQQLDKLIVDHVHLQRSWESDQNLFIIKIDEWERNSMDQIQKMATDIRTELRMEFDKYTSQCSKQWKELEEDLKTTQDRTDLMEMDLQQLSIKFNKLKARFASTPTIDFEENTWISRPILHKRPDDIFDVYAGNLEIQEYGQIVQHGSSIGHAVVRGSGEYNSGIHRFQFKIETFNINKWIFFGIISHRITMHPNTWAIPSCYGWGGQDSTILNCAMHSNFNGYSCDFELNDTIELIMDCDHRIIRLTNQRTNRTHMMNIDLAKCPFPWHFLLNLFYPRDQVRILFSQSQ